MHTTLTQQSQTWLTMLFRHSVGNCWYWENKVTCNLSENTLPTVASARWATVDWFWPKECSWCVQADLYCKQNKTTKQCRHRMVHQTFPRNPHMQGKIHHQSKCILYGYRGETDTVESAQQLTWKNYKIPFTFSLSFFSHFMLCILLDFSVLFVMFVYVCYAECVIFRMRW